MATAAGNGVFPWVGTVKRTTAHTRGGLGGDGGGIPPAAEGGKRREVEAMGGGNV